MYWKKWPPESKFTENSVVLYSITIQLTQIEQLSTAQSVQIKKKTWELSSKRDRFVLYSALLEFFLSLIFKFNSFLSTCWWYHELVRLNCSYFLVFRFRWHHGMMYHTFESQTFKNGQSDFIIDMRDLKKIL